VHDDAGAGEPSDETDELDELDEYLVLVQVSRIRDTQTGELRPVDPRRLVVFDDPVVWVTNRRRLLAQVAPVDRGSWR
jgi:hypothetical protein